MLTKHISFKNFLIKKKYSVIKKNLNEILSEKNQVIFSLSNFYKDSFNKKNIKNLKKKSKIYFKIKIKNIFYLVPAQSLLV